MSEVNPDNKCAQLDIQIPYNKQALGKMLHLQNSLQEFMKERRDIIVPTDNVPMAVKAKESIYFWGCATTEFFELCEAIEKTEECEEYKSTAAWREVQFEYIDIWHFLMNTFLYGGYMKERKSLGDFYSDVHSLYYVGPLSASSALAVVERLWGELSVSMGQYINNLPFKAWKNYPADLQVDEAVLFDKIDMVISKFIHIGYVLGIDAELFYALYVAKNRENIERQNRVGQYHSQR